MESGPVSKTMQAASEARRRRRSASTFGSNGHLPCHTGLPSLRTETAVSFIETSRPTYSAILTSIRSARASCRTLCIGGEDPEPDLAQVERATRSPDYPMWTPPVGPASHLRDRSMGHHAMATVSPLACGIVTQSLHAR